MSEKRIRTDYWREYSRKNREKKNAQARAAYGADLLKGRAKSAACSKNRSPAQRVKRAAAALSRYYADHESNRMKANKRARKAREVNPQRVNMTSLISHHKDPIAKFLRLSKVRAKKKGIAHNLGREDIVVPDVCPILGIKLHTGLGVKLHAGTPTLDRKDNSLGYVKGNVHVISWRANRLKADGTVAELEKILEYMRQ